MPPLLPDSLRDPTHIILQASPTDWPPVVVAALATLIGSFGGALIGGLVAYRGTLRANSLLLKRQKLEEALGIVENFDQQMQKVSIGVYQLPHRESEDHGIHGNVSQKLQSLNINEARRALTLVQIYEKDLYNCAMDAYGGLLQLIVLSKLEGLSNDDWTEIAGLIKETSSDIRTLKDKLVAVLAL